MPVVGRYVLRHLPPSSEVVVHGTTVPVRFAFPSLGLKYGLRPSRPLEVPIDSSESDVDARDESPPWQSLLPAQAASGVSYFGRWPSPHSGAVGSLRDRR